MNPSSPVGQSRSELNSSPSPNIQTSEDATTRQNGCLFCLHNTLIKVRYYLFLIP